MNKILNILHVRVVAIVSLCALLSTGLIILPKLSYAEEIMRIAAVVNDQVISIYDLAARINIVVAASNIADAPELRRQIAPQILQKLVNENLQTQEAVRLNLAVTDLDIKNTLARIEQNLGVGPGGFENFITSRKLDREAAIQQVTAEIAWGKVVSARLRSKISVGEDEIDEVLTRLKNSRGQPENRIAEIFLAIQSPDQEEKISQTARNLILQLKQGGNFSSIAQQFSQSATSAVGGDVGWVIKGQLPKPIDQALSSMKKGEVSDVIRTFDGLHIIKLVDRRFILTANPLDAKLTLIQLITDGKVENNLLFKDKLDEVRSKSKNCGDILSLSSEFTSSQSGYLGTVTLRDLSPKLQKVVRSLQIMEISEPLSFKSGYRILMVCKREEKIVELPSRSSLRRDIGNRRLELMARRYLRDLRRSAFIDFRI